MKSTDAKRLFISRFLRIFRRNGMVAIVHQLRPEPIYLLEKSWNEIASEVARGTQPNHDIMSWLISRKLLIGDPGVDQQSLEVARREALRLLNRPSSLYLMMAQGCNFACSYCPIPILARRYGERLLSFEDAIAGISLWQKHIEDYPQDNEPYSLIFYGGEPLLNQEVLEKLLPYVANELSVGRLPKRLELMLCTNGSMIDERLSKLFALYKITVSVGIDGPQEHNDRIRITSDGNPTSTIIRRAIKQLVDDGVRVVASVTITPANVHQLAEYPNFLRKLGIAQFGFNLMKGEALVRELAGRSMEDYCRGAARGVLAGLADTTEDGRWYEYQLGRRMFALQNNLPFSVECCYGNHFVIQPDGQVGSCPFLCTDQGYVRELPDTFRIGRTEAMRDRRCRLPLFNDLILEDSKDCLLDGGGCAWSSSELYGNATARDMNNAIFTKEVINELIWIFLHEEQAEAIRRGEITHWSYRRFGSLHAPGIDGH